MVLRRVRTQFAAALPPPTRIRTGFEAVAIPGTSWFPEIFFAAFLVGLVMVQILQDASLFAASPGSDWNSSEWMIDYAGGFVRRGLGGFVLRLVTRYTGILFFPLWMSLTTGAYLALVVRLVILSRRLGGSALWRFALLLNPMLLISAAEYGSFARKDILFLWGTLLNLTLAHSCLTRNQARRAWHLPSAAGLLGGTSVLSLALALLHEGIFLFAWLPLNVAIVAYTLIRLGFRKPTVSLFLAAAFSPALMAVAAGAFRHGDPHMAQAICSSWSFAVCSRGGAYPPAIEALAWSVSRDIHGCLAFAPLFPLYLVAFVLFGAVEIAAVSSLLPAARIEHLVASLLFAFTAALPLFVLGADWGRWLFLVATASLFLMLSELLRPAVFCLLPRSLRTACCRIAVALERALAVFRTRAEAHPLLFGGALLMLPIAPLPIPAAALLANPIAIFINFFSHLPHR